MGDDFIVARLKDAIRRERQRDPQEQFDELVRLGVIDDQGRVLVRMPEPEKQPRKPKKSNTEPSAAGNGPQF
jgi:hypothetical protein